MDLQRFGEERVVPQALGSPGVRQRGLEPAHAVGVGDRQASSAHSDPTHHGAGPLLQGNWFDVFYRNVGKDHRVAVVLDVEVEVSPQTHLMGVREEEGRAKDEVETGGEGGR